MKERKGSFRRAGSFSMGERRKIVQEYLTGDLNKSEIWFKYTGSISEHSNLNRWMNQLGIKPVKVYENYHSKDKSVKLESSTLIALPKKESNKTKAELEKENQELKRQLELAKVQAEGYRMMIDIAEKDYKLEIRKKPNTK